MAKAPTKAKVRRFTTPPFVLSYPHLFEAQKMQDQANSRPTFSCSAIWKPGEFTESDKKLWSAINAEIVRVCNAAKWPGGVKIVGKNRKEIHAELQKKFPQSAKFAVRNGEDERPDREGYGPGTLFANLRSTERPGVVLYAPPGETPPTVSPDLGNADEIYPGCICRATITIFAYPDGRKDHGGRGYSFGLGNVQKLKDGKRLDSRVAAEDDFDEDVDAAWLDQGDGDESGGEETAPEDTDDEIPF